MKNIIFILLTLLASTTVYSMDLTDTQVKNLVKNAQEARLKAYAPYSTYQVGAALLSEDGQIIQGCNVENASYGLTNCAERSAIFSAVSMGKKNFQAISVVTKDGGSPCGACRQVINEFNPDMVVIIAKEDGTVVAKKTLRELLPEAFGPKNLQDTIECTPKK